MAVICGNLTPHKAHRQLFYGIYSHDFEWCSGIPSEKQINLEAERKLKEDLRHLRVMRQTERKIARIQKRQKGAGT